MSELPLRIEKIARHHRSLLKDFQNQHESLATYPRRFGLRHATRDLIGGTFLVIVTDDDGDDRLAGYFSLTTTSLAREQVDAVEGAEELDKLPQFPIPGVLLTRLAVDQRLQGQGLGTYLMEEVFERVIGTLQTRVLTFRVLVTDAIDADAVSFYEHFGLIGLSDEYPARMVMDLKKLLERIEQS